jgi:hypothetical protein
MFSRLTALVRPPVIPTERPPLGGWETIEQTWTPLPTDYKQYIDTYGTGYFCDGYFAIFNPFSQNPYLNLMNQGRIVADAFRVLSQHHPDVYTFSFFPPLGGYMPFGINIDGAYIVWKTVGQPADWPVGVIASRSPRIQLFQMGVVEWLVKLLSGEVRCVHFAGDLLEGEVSFIGP